MTLLLLLAAAFELVQLDEGIYAALVDPQPPMYVFANALIVIDDEAVTVIDTHQSPSAAEALIAEIRGLTAKPVRFVVNTHWHGDHVYGNQAYLEHFPGVVFIGHHTIREDMLERGAARLAEELRTLPDTIGERKGWLDSGRGPDGEVMTAELRERVDYSYRMRRDYLAELRGLELRPPQLTFGRELVLHRPGRTISGCSISARLTRAATWSCICRRRKFFAVGDLLEDAFPYFGDGYPSGWADVLERIGRLDASVILPSHGPLLRDRELLTMETRLLRTLVDEVAAARGRGLSLEQAKTSITLDAFREHFPSGFDDRRRGRGRARVSRKTLTGRMDVAGVATFSSAGTA